MIKKLGLILSLIFSLTFASSVGAVDLQVDSCNNPNLADSDICKEIKREDNSPEQRIVKVLMTIVPWVFGLAALMLVYAGFLYASAFGNADKIKLAKSIITYTILGIIMILIAGTIYGFFVNQISNNI